MSVFAASSRLPECGAIRLHCSHEVNRFLTSVPLMTRVARLLLAAALLTSTSAVWAHHSYASVDMTRRVTVHGAVKAFEWTNPHVWLWIVRDDDNGTATYGFEGLAPSELTRFFGWNKRILSVGDKITVEYAPFKNGQNGGALSKVIFTDGRVLLGRRANPPSGDSAASPRPPK